MSQFNASHILTWHLGVTVFAIGSGVAIGRVSRLRRNLPWVRCE
ncbi:MAG: hypothetical protein JWP63_1065 [Candidatus Solibacter sp.]|nr:hypothetical protein [Candidatus Solibacter sp.]